MLKINRENGTLDFIDGGGCEIQKWGMSIEADGRRQSSTQARMEVPSDPPMSFAVVFAEIGLSWNFRVEEDRQQGRLIFHSTLTNSTHRPIALGKVTLMDVEGGIRPGQGLTETVILPLSGHFAARRVYKVIDADCPRSSKIKIQLFDRVDRRAMQIGFLTFQRANTEIEHAVNAEEATLGIRAWCDFAGWTLGPGQQTPVETFTVAVGDDPYRQLEQWADLAAGMCRPRRWEDAPVGWLGWAWVDPFTVENYEEVLLRNCQAIQRRLKGFGVNYVWLSLGNLADANPGDWLNWNYKWFPSGPSLLQAKLKALGMKWGLWCGAFWMCSLLKDKVAELREALQKNSDGSLRIVQPAWPYGAGGEMPKANRPCIYALDPSHPQSLSLLRQTFETYRKWGVRYYMIDFLHVAAGNIGEFAYNNHFDRTLVAGPEVYQTALRAIRQAAGDDTYLLASTGPTIHNAGVFDGVRTGLDFGEGRALYRDSYFYPSTFIINSGEFWTGPLLALLNQATAYYTHRKLYLNDSGNVLTVDKPLPRSDAQVHATIHALSGGPSMIGDDVDRMDDERLNLIKKTLPRPRDVAFPVDLFESCYPAFPRIFHRKVVRPWGTYDVVAVYNFSEDMIQEHIELSRLRLKHDAQYLVWEFWNSAYLGRASEALTVRVPPKSVCVYRVVEDPGRPVLLGTDLHILMGEMEIDGCTWDPLTKTLFGRAIRPCGEKGNIFIHAPKTVRVANPRGHWIAKDALDRSLIIRAALDFEEGSAVWSIQFADLFASLDMGKADPA